MKQNVKIAVSCVALVAALCGINLVAELCGGGVAIFKFTLGHDGMGYGGILYGLVVGVFLAVFALFYLVQADNFRNIIRWAAMPFVAIIFIGATCFNPSRDYAAMDTLGIAMGMAVLFLIFSELITREEMNAA